MDQFIGLHFQFAQQKKLGPVQRDHLFIVINKVNKPQRIHGSPLPCALCDGAVLALPEHLRALCNHTVDVVVVVVVFVVVVVVVVVVVFVVVVIYCHWRRRRRWRCLVAPCV